MRALKSGMSGDDVKKWQAFLEEQKLYRLAVSGEFNDDTVQATIDFQRLHELLPADGIVNNRTCGMAMLLGYKIFEEDPQQQ